MLTEEYSNYATYAAKALQKEDERNIFHNFVPWISMQVTKQLQQL